MVYSSSRYTCSIFNDGSAAALQEDQSKCAFHSTNVWDMIKHTSNDKQWLGSSLEEAIVNLKDLSSLLRRISCHDQWHSKPNIFQVSSDCQQIINRLSKVKTTAPMDTLSIDCLLKNYQQNIDRIVSIDYQQNLNWAPVILGTWPSIAHCVNKINDDIYDIRL